MPNLDQTGPKGDGPMTGGGFGRCAGGRRSAGQGWGRRFGFGGGRGGRGRRFGQWARSWFGGASSFSQDNEREATREEISFLERELAQARQRLEDLEK